VFGDDVDGPVPPGEAQQPVDVLVRGPLLQGPGRIASDRGVRGDVPEEDRAKTTSGDDGDVIVPILTISQSASSMTH
jgi:hypothetical protein